MDDTKKYLFPHDTFRDIQKEMVEELAEAFEKSRCVIAHAPTGLGKTAAAIAPALTYALKNKKKVFFLTSRHTQHTIAIETLRKIKQKYSEKFIALDLIGKKWMCPVPHVQKLRSGEFSDYCKKQKEDLACEYYSKTKSGSKLSPYANLTLEKVKIENPCHIERFVDICSEENMCPPEIAAALSKDADVIVADYYYIYNDRVRDTFFNKAEVALGDCIVIVDEAHNLPDRIRNLMSITLGEFHISRSLNEAKKLKDNKLGSKVLVIKRVLEELAAEIDKDRGEIIVEKEDFISRINDKSDYDVLQADFQIAGELVKSNEKQSMTSHIASFLETWLGDDKGYVRVLKKEGIGRDMKLNLSYKCLDPSLVTKEIISKCHSTVLMSGTLTPTSMYKDILGFPHDTVEKRYRSTFPDENRLNLIVPETTTKFSSRGEQQYKRMAEITSEIVNDVPGNSAVFFPSYFLRDQVYKHITRIIKKPIFLERSDMSKEEKAEFLEGFREQKDTGGVLLGVVSGSFGEGIDLPGDLLKCVIVIGLPLQQPNLEVKSLISYYDEKFGKGWDYGYVGPAFAKCLQSAGRCIRSETDRGVIVFLDERYPWQNYFKHFPIDWKVDVTKNYEAKVNMFFSK